MIPLGTRGFLFLQQADEKPVRIIPGGDVDTIDAGDGSLFVFLFL